MVLQISAQNHVHPLYHQCEGKKESFHCNQLLTEIKKYEDNSQYEKNVSFKNM